MWPSIPASHYIVPAGEDGGGHLRTSGREMEERVKFFQERGQAHRGPAHCSSAPTTIWRCSPEIGFCKGIENYSRVLSRPAGRAARPFTLLDYFPEDFLLFVDESHVTLPQVRGMYARRPLPEEDPGGLRLPPAVGL